LPALRADLERLLRRTQRIPYIDPVDVRYRRFEPVPRPVAQAVMFCLMDVSGSMTEDMKDLAKRFYVLLYLFLQRRYKHVELVFIRHTHEAAEVDEETFFHSRETGRHAGLDRAGGDAARGGGPLPAGRLEHLRRAGLGRRQRLRRQPAHGAPADGGDPAGLPVLRLHRGRARRRARDAGFPRGPTDLWRTYETLVAMGAPMAMKKVRHRREIFPVFRELFQKQPAGGEGARA
jgi:hypothetical protein